MENIITIDGRKIGQGQPPYIIAEISGNHNGSIKRAKKLINLAKQSGACAVKLQTFTADSLTINTENPDFTLKEGTWAGNKLYDLYNKIYTPWEWFPELFIYASKIGITIFSSPFDKSAVDFLEELNVPAYKIASNELTDWPLVEAVVITGKPIILSTGTASRNDICDTIDFIRKNGGNQLVMLHCVSAYPALPEETFLQTMLDIRDNLNVICGLSDHTLGTTTSVAAVAIGANVIEKHITINRSDGGPDSSFSLEPHEFSNLCHETKWAWDSIQGIKYGADTNLEKKGIFTRQFWSTKDIYVGDELSELNIKSIRAPANSKGVPTRYFREIYGKKAKRFIPKHSAICFEFI